MFASRRHIKHLYRASIYGANAILVLQDFAAEASGFVEVEIEGCGSWLRSNLSRNPSLHPLKINSSESCWRCRHSTTALRIIGMEAGRNFHLR
jgi:hypothetical protein